MGLYAPGAPHSPSLSWRYTTGTAIGNVPFTIPGSITPGTYELRLFANNGYTLLATSSGLTVTGPVKTVSGTVTLGSSPLAGVAFSATNSGACTSSNASGQYSCTVPQGWSGSVTPSLSSYSFAPPSRSHSNVVGNLTGQDFAATVSTASTTTYYIHTDHLNTPRLISNLAAQVVWRWDQLEPFGVTPANDNPSGVGVFEFNLRFPGQYFDKETNNHYNYFRDYDPSIGRYAESDPIGLNGGLNSYLYSNNNPLVLTDEFGLQVDDISGPDKHPGGRFPLPRGPLPPPRLPPSADQIVINTLKVCVRALASGPGLVSLGALGALWPSQLACPPEERECRPPPQPMPQFVRD